MTSQLLTRDQLGMRDRTGEYAPLNAEGITVHHGGPTPWRSGWDTLDEFLRLCDHARCPSIWRAWQDFHMTPGALGTRPPAAPIDIAYTSGICPHGVRFEGRGPMHRTAANGSNEGNRRSYACVYIAGLTKDGREDPLTDAAKLAFLDERDRLLKEIRWVHSDWYSTQCPGTYLKQWQRANCPRPGVLPPAPLPAPVVPPRIWTGQEFTLEDDMRIRVMKVDMPDLGSDPDAAYVDLDGREGRPAVAAGRCTGVRVNGANERRGGGAGDVRDLEFNGFTRLRFRDFDKHAKPSILVSAIVD